MTGPDSDVDLLTIDTETSVEINFAEGMKTEARRAREIGRQNKFLTEIGIDYTMPWDWSHTQQAHKAWDGYVSKRREYRLKKRPVADILIGSYACKIGGLITRNEADFRSIFPSLLIRNPAKS